MCNTPKASNTNAGRIERASQKVEKRSRTSRSWFEVVSVERVCKKMPDTVRNCAWQIPRRLAWPGRVKQIESPCGRPRYGQVSEFTELNHFREPQKPDEWSLRLLRSTVTVSSGHWRGTPARVPDPDPSGDARRIDTGTECRSLICKVNGGTHDRGKGRSYRYKTGSALP